LTFDKIIESIKKKEFSPVYFLHGEESFFIDAIVDEIQDNVLTAQEREFNQMVFYGKDASAQNIINSAKQYPMMAQKRVIILREAQQMKNLKDLLPYIENPVDSTVLVIAYKGKKLDTRTSFGKKVKNNALVFESKKLYENQIGRWIKTYAKSKGMNLTDDACSLMTVLLGTELSKIDNELEKLKIAVGSEKKIELNDVKDNIGLNREYNVYELNNALGAKDVAKAFRIIDIFGANTSQYPLIYILITLYGFFTKVLIVSENIRKSDVELSQLAKFSRFFARDYRLAARNYSRAKLIDVIGILKEYDLKSKGVGVRSPNQIELMKEMVLKILS